VGLVRAADPRLAPLVSRIGYFRGSFDHGRELALPTGGVQVLISLAADVLHAHDVGDPRRSQRTGGAALQGPTDRPSLIDAAAQQEIVWVAFRAGGACPFFPIDSVDVRGRLVDLGDLWGQAGAGLRERLLEADGPAAALRALEETMLTRATRATRAVEPDPAVSVAAAALHAGMPVGAVADMLGWTPRRLSRQFTSRVGLPPKRFGRVRRFQRLLRAAGDGADPDWARLAADCGFYDQAHLINDFRDLSGLTPGTYRPRSAEEPNHVPLAD
jgi:AraC-like DNA-binding protein